MKNTIIGLILSLTMLFTLSCGKKEAALKESAKTTTAEHGLPGAAPGSHEDWCGGHQVAESMCTQCNPALAAAFKATGDWCAEHGLPESQCRLCNPNLKIERPPQKQGL